MRKKWTYLILIAVVILGAGIVVRRTDTDNTSNHNNSQSQTAEHEAQEDIQTFNTESQQEEPTETEGDALQQGMIGFDDWKNKSWEEIAELYSNYADIYNIEREFNSEDSDLTKWFEEYNGEDFQIISSEEYEHVTVRNRREIVFYRTEQEDVQKVLKDILTELIDTLMEDSEGRPYTITRYELDENQPLKAINENVWILDGIEGYYSYEGTDMGTMEEVLAHETDVKDGMIPFLAQGSSSTGQYILIRNEDVYRLQKAGEMGFGVEY